jgi:hypothetical protein
MCCVRLLEPQDVFGSEWLAVGAGEHEVLVTVVGARGEALEPFALDLPSEGADDAVGEAGSRTVAQCRRNAAACAGDQQTRSRLGGRGMLA